MSLKLQPYERGIVHAVAMEPGIKEVHKRTILKRFANALDRPYLEQPLLDALDIYLLEQRKAADR